MNEPKILIRYKSRYDNELKNSLSSVHSQAYSMLRYCMGWEDINGESVDSHSGKGLRPSLCLFVSDATGTGLHQSAQVATSIELIHNFSLVHDEIQDLDKIRHHRPTIWTIWGKRKSLIAGNLMQVAAHNTINLIDFVDENSKASISNLLGKACIQMLEGQNLDLLFEKNDSIELEDYLHMISLKTGALLRASLNLGAVLNVKDPNILNAIDQTGKALGYAFQIRDDILGVWGTEDVTGKPVGADIRRKKKSLPIVHAMGFESGKYANELKKIYSHSEISDDDVNQVLEIMNQIKTREYAEDLTNNYLEAALISFRNSKVINCFQDDFKELIEFLATRNY
ncbi:MAG: polyprenyl synthetase family protein [SAR202 cluster bacterium]|nr:polyprenyl synthetase family protein [SAR202 cluster bacterium]